MLYYVMTGVYLYGVLIALVADRLYQKYCALHIDGKKRSFVKSLCFSAILTYFHPVFLGIHAVRKQIQKEQKSTVNDTGNTK